jgi:hypothetical protein
MNGFQTLVSIPTCGATSGRAAGGAGCGGLGQHPAGLLTRGGAHGAGVQLDPTLNRVESAWLQR